MDCFPPDPNEEGNADSLVQVGIELSNQLLYRGTMVFHHLGPTVGLQYFPNEWNTHIEVCHLEPSLYRDSALVVVFE